MSDPTPTPLVAWATPGSGAAPVTEPGAAPGGAPVRLWTARDVGAISFLLGFPAGIGLTAVNWHHLGRRRSAYGLLGAGATLLVVLFLASSLPTGIGVGLNTVVSVLLYALVRRQWAVADQAGRPVQRGGVLPGFLVSVGGWFVTLLPTLVLFVALTFLGRQVADILKGTVEFGTGGDACEISGATTTFTPAQPIHLAAHLNREVLSGETVRVSIMDATGTLLDTADRPITSTADCISGTFDAGIVAPGSYTLDYRVGSELLAHGKFTVRAAGASSP